MTAYTATAPGKIILFGEHSVVYGRPAMAAPVNQVQARVVVQIEPTLATGQMRIQAPDIRLDSALSALPDSQPLKQAVLLVQKQLGVARIPACTVRITSSIPVASGLGSGAAVSVALIRALAGFLGRPLPDERVSALAFEIEKLYHGTPSGVDNTVITYACPVYYQRDHPIERLVIASPFHLVIGDTGIASPTSVTVGDVRKAWETDPERYEALFDIVGDLVRAARGFLEGGDFAAMGQLMDENHAMLRRLGVSGEELDKLVKAARGAGALGAKLSGGGRGGNMIALVTADTADRVASTLKDSGARRVIVTTIRPEAAHGRF